MGEEGRRHRLSGYPSGRQFEISSGPYRATIVEVGGGIRTLAHDDRPIIEGYPPNAVCDGARGQLLLPWPNRIEDASYTFGGATEHLSVTEPATGCAIHGLTRWANWSCVDHADDMVTMACRLHPQPGWPGTIDLEANHRLGASGLTVTVTAHNRSAIPLPFGAGAHPYLITDDEPSRANVAAPSNRCGAIDDWELTLGASTVVTTDDRGLPNGRHPVEDTPYDFRCARQIGPLALDHPFTDLARDDAGRSWARLTGPSGRHVSVWADSRHRWFQVFTGDHLADPARRRTAVAIEPMTCPPNAFRTGEDLITLAPDESVTIRWGICTM